MSNDLLRWFCQCVTAEWVPNMYKMSCVISIVSTAMSIVPNRWSVAAEVILDSVRFNDVWNWIYPLFPSLSLHADVRIIWYHQNKVQKYLMDI